ncbi:MAG: Ldh family oxidoreductase [Pirellulales bacterium]|nr:Ldh family oxidoreductase [Pirellulales bacterium]
MPQISSAQLTHFAQNLLQAGGLSAAEASLVAHSLVQANLRGHDSHGVMRIPYYLEALNKREVVAGADFTIIRQQPAIIQADGHWGFGQTQMRRLLDLLLDMVKTTGVAVGTLIRSSHIGRLGEYCELAAEAGMVSMLMVNTHGHARRVAPPGGIAPRLGTNPLAFGVPAENGPLILDFGTSATAEGKVRLRKIAGQQVPTGWLLDNQGQPTTDPNTLYGSPPGTILPLGGEQGFKGFALGMMVEIFAGALSGGVCIREQPLNQNGNCVFMQVFDPAALGGAEHFRDEVAQLLNFIRNTPLASGVEKIQLAGDPERQCLGERTARGIPIDQANWNQLLTLASNLGVEFSQ